MRLPFHRPWYQIQIYNINKPGDAGRHLTALTHDEIGPYLKFRKAASRFSATLDLVHPPLQLFLQERCITPSGSNSISCWWLRKIPHAGEWRMKRGLGGTAFRTIFKLSYKNSIRELYWDQDASVGTSSSATVDAPCNKILQSGLRNRVGHMYF